MMLHMIALLRLEYFNKGFLCLIVSVSCNYRSFGKKNNLQSSARSLLFFAVKNCKLLIRTRTKKIF